MYGVSMDTETSKLTTAMANVSPISLDLLNKLYTRFPYKRPDADQSLPLIQRAEGQQDVIEFIQEAVGIIPAKPKTGAVAPVPRMPSYHYATGPHDLPKAKT